LSSVIQSKIDICFHIIFSETYSYSYVGINLSNSPIEVTVDAAKYSK